MQTLMQTLFEKAKTLDPFTCVITATIVIAVIAIIVSLLKDRKNTNKMFIKDKDEKNYLYAFYVFFSKFPFTKTYYQRLMLKVQMYYPSDSFSVNKKTTALMLLGSISGFISLIFTLILANGDLFFVCAGVFVTMVVITSAVNSKLDKMEYKLLDQFRTFLVSIRQYYSVDTPVEDALFSAMDNTEYELQLHLQKIYDILCTPSPLMEELTAEYIEEAPLSYMSDFLAVASAIHENGDERLEGGQTIFLFALNKIQDIANADKVKRDGIKKAFFLLKGIALSAVVLIKPLDKFVIDSFADAKTYFQGAYGTFTMILIFVFSYLVYLILSSLRNFRRGTIKETSVFKKVADMPIISPILTSEVNRHFNKCDILNGKLKRVGDHTGVKAFILKSLLIGFASVIISTLLFFTSIFTEKKELLTDFTTSYSDAIVPNEDYLNTLRDTSKEYAKIYVGKGNVDRETVISDLETNADLGNDTYVEMVADEIVTRAGSYTEIYYKYYYLLWTIAAFLIGCVLPYLYLLFKIVITNMDQAMEVNQFNTFVMLFMHFGGTTTDKLLEWCERYAYCFKQSLTECRLNLDENEYDAIMTMKEREDFPEFRKFCDCLSNIENVGIETAFSSVVNDYSYYMDNLRMTNADTIKQRGSIGTFMAFIPWLMAITLRMAAPIVILASNMQQSFKNVGF